mmetsp:Transcript_34366/g.110425  ORF Transcript_34366/g.110425 Transcript_34366/m.110425 type:complete len:222 (-) Transcript_34366:1097-1762(-)
MATPSHVDTCSSILALAASARGPSPERAAPLTSSNFNLAMRAHCSASPRRGDLEASGRSTDLMPRRSSCSRKASSRRSPWMKVNFKGRFDSEICFSRASNHLPSLGSMISFPLTSINSSVGFKTEGYASQWGFVSSTKTKWRPSSPYFAMSTWNPRRSFVKVWWKTMPAFSIVSRWSRSNRLTFCSYSSCGVRFFSNMPPNIVFFFSSSSFSDWSARSRGS